MTRRCRVLPGQTWAMSRRTTRRHFLFTPDDRRIEQAFWYCLAYAAKETGVVVYGATLLSTHPHYIIGDPRGERPRFKRRFHRLFANCTKAIRGWPGEVFDKRSTGEHELLTADALIQSLAYLIAQGPACGAVRYSHEWPGAKTLPSDLGRRVVVAQRPDVFFDSDNPQWPEQLELEMPMHPMLSEQMHAEEARRRIAARVRELERDALAESRRRGTPFRSARRVRKIPHTHRASTNEPFGARNPSFAAAGDLEAARHAIAKRRVFDADYDEALARWTAKDRRAVFPAGTWWMRVHHGARCRPPP